MPTDPIAIAYLRSDLARPNPKGSDRVNVSRKLLTSVLDELERLTQAGEQPEGNPMTREQSIARLNSIPEADLDTIAVTKEPMASERRPVVSESISWPGCWTVTRFQPGAVVGEYLYSDGTWNTGDKQLEPHGHFPDRATAEAALAEWQAKQTTDQPPATPDRTWGAALAQGIRDQAAVIDERNLWKVRAEAAEAKLAAPPPAMPTREELGGKTPWQFACEWYQPDEIHRSIQNRHRSGVTQDIPADIESRLFAVWLTDQYRLAMHKGIEIGQRSCEARDHTAKERELNATIGGLERALEQARQERDEARGVTSLVLGSLRWTGDGYEWTGGEIDYRVKPHEAVKLMAAERKQLETNLATARRELAEARQELAEYQGDNLSRCCGCRFDDGKLATECLQHAEVRQALEAERAGNERWLKSARMQLSEIRKELAEAQIQLEQERAWAGAMRKALEHEKYLATIARDVQSNSSFAAEYQERIDAIDAALQSTAGQSLRAELTELKAERDSLKELVDAAFQGRDPRKELAAAHTAEVESLKSELAEMSTAHAETVTGLRGEIAALQKQWNDLDQRNEKRHREWSEQLSTVTAQRDAAVERLKEVRKFIDRDVRQRVGHWPALETAIPVMLQKIDATLAAAPEWKSAVEHS